MTPSLTIIEAMDDDALFGKAFNRNRKSWAPWRVALKALFGLPLSDSELPIFTELTARHEPPDQQAREAWFVCGRRARKTFIAAVIGLYMAAFIDWRPHLAPGERAMVMLLAADRRQARQLIRYIQGLIGGSAILKRMVAAEQAESIELSNGSLIEVHTASMRTVRGYGAACVICDEISYWRTDDALANPDREILAALRPTMATLPGSLLIGLSSPYRRAGVLWEAFRDHHGREGDPVLVIHGPSRTMNPTLPAKIVEDAYADDPQVADAEYGAQFRSDVAGFLDHDWVERAAKFDGDLPPVEGKIYKAFADPSGGGRDAFTLAIAHHEDGHAIVDCVRATRPPFDPASVAKQYADLCKQYSATLKGDRYAGAWVTSAFADAGVRYQSSELTKSEIYLEAEPLFARGSVAIPRHRPLLSELRSLERRTMRSGKDQVDHPLRGSDDIANSVCGAIVEVTPKKQLEQEPPAVLPALVDAGGEAYRIREGAMPSFVGANPNMYRW